MSLIIVLILGAALWLAACPASANVWKCHTPEGDIWTSSPGPSDDCQEYNEQYNPSAAPPVTQNSLAPVAPQAVPPPVVPSQIVPVPVPVPVVPPPYVGTYIYPPYYYGPRYYIPGAIIVRPAFGYPHGFSYGGQWHEGRFRRW